MCLLVNSVSYKPLLQGLISLGLLQILPGGTFYWFLCFHNTPTDNICPPIPSLFPSLPPHCLNTQKTSLAHI